MKIHTRSSDNFTACLCLTGTECNGFNNIYPWLESWDLYGWNPEPLDEISDGLEWFFGVVNDAFRPLAELAKLAWPRDPKKKGWTWLDALYLMLPHKGVIFFTLKDRRVFNRLVPCIQSLFSIKATKLMKSLPLIWNYVVSVKWTEKISSFFVAFLENTNFKTWN